MKCDLTADTVDLILGEEPHLRRVARRLARCSSDADDLVQETLIRAYAARARFEPGTSIRAWTSTILRRAFLTGAIAHKRRRMNLNCDAGDPIALAPSRCGRTARDTPARIEDLGASLDDDLLDAFERLPEWYRRPFFLYVVHDMTCAEIARTLGLPEGTVMSRIHRARGRLRAALAGPDGRRVWRTAAGRGHGPGVRAARAVARLPRAS